MIDEFDVDDVYKCVQMLKFDVLFGLCEMILCCCVWLLNYFGEVSQLCGNCDMCFELFVLWDVMCEVQMVLLCVFCVQCVSGFNFGLSYLIEILCGGCIEKVLQCGYDQFSMFGIGVVLFEFEWCVIFWQFVVYGYLVVDYGGFGVLMLIEVVKFVLKNEEKVMLCCYVKLQCICQLLSCSGMCVDLMVGMGVCECVWWDVLCVWCVEIVKMDGVLVYVIFYDVMFVEIVCNVLEMIDDLCYIFGMGVCKFECFGDEIIDVVELV